jgi:anti-sigma factor RsiW
VNHPFGGCADLLPCLSAYLDGEAASALCAQLDAHLAECRDCRVVVDTLTCTVRLYHTLPDPALPEGATARLFAALDLPVPKGEESDLTQRRQAAKAEKNRPQRTQSAQQERLSFRP